MQRGVEEGEGEQYLLVFVLLHIASAGTVKAVCCYYAQPCRAPQPPLLGLRQPYHKTCGHPQHRWSCGTVQKAQMHLSPRCAAIAPSP